MGIGEVTANDVSDITNGIYSQRNRLAIGLCKAAIAAGWNAGRHIDTDHPEWEPEWCHVIMISVPNGMQILWHMSPAELPLLEGLPKYKGEWDKTYFSNATNWPDLVPMHKVPEWNMNQAIDEIKRLKALDKVKQELIDFYSKYISSTNNYLHVHNMLPSAEDIAKGLELRARIKILEENIGK